MPSPGPSPGKVPVPPTRQRLNDELQPPVPRFGQFYEVCLCVGEVALQYYALARAYSIVCGPSPVAGTRVHKGRHNALVRELMLEYHKSMDDTVFSPFDSRRRLLVGKQTVGSQKPVWDFADAEKSTSLSLVFMREHCSFKNDFSSILYDAGDSSWFHATGTADDCIDPATKAAFVGLRQKVVEYAERNSIVILPSIPGQWWLTFARDAVEDSSAASSPLSLASSPTSKKSPSFLFNKDSVSLASSFAAAFQTQLSPVSAPPLVGSGPTVLASNRGPQSSAVISSVEVRSGPPIREALNFETDRPRFAECQLADGRALKAIRESRKSEASKVYDCNALGLTAGGNFPSCARKGGWQAVVDARIHSLKVESKRKRVNSEFRFNALGETEDGKSFFQFCTNFTLQRSVYHHDEITLLALEPYGNSSTVSSRSLKRDITYLREKLGKKTKTLDDDTDELLSAYRKLAKAANKRVKEEGDDLGIYLTKWGLIWHAGESS